MSENQYSVDSINYFVNEQIYLLLFIAIKNANNWIIYCEFLYKVPYFNLDLSEKFVLPINSNGDHKLPNCRQINVKTE